jgi:hypothetical protein
MTFGRYFKLTCTIMTFDRKVVRYLANLICGCMGNLEKPHDGIHASDPMSLIFNNVINMGYNLFRPIRLLVANKAV